jgi:FKBP-type peptidyl-prolyl cis-trans isomerase SlyD
MNADNMLILKRDRDVIGQDKVVRLRFRVDDALSGEVLQFGDDLYYLHGGYGGAFPKVEQALDGCQVGDTARLTLSPEDGYGYRDAALELVVPSHDFDDTRPEAGEAVEGQLPDGQSMVFTVTAVSAKQVTLDGNHPFAGKHLAFEFEVLEIRDSIAAERSAGFAFDGMFC